MVAPADVRCQSCSMPLAEAEDFGTEADGGRAAEYCRYCYQQGRFTAPDMTVNEMQERVASLVKGVPPDEVRKIVAAIPGLKRWRRKK